MPYGKPVAIKGTILEKPTYGLRVYTYNAYTSTGKKVVQFEVSNISEYNFWVKMLHPEDPKDGVVRKKLLKEGYDDLGPYFGFNYYGDFQIIYLFQLTPDRIIKK